MVSEPRPPASRTERQQREVKAAEAAFPRWEFIKIPGGWLTVPKGTPVIQALDMDGIVEKLRAREDM